MKRSPSRFLYSTRTSSWPLPAFFTPPNLTSSSLAFLPPCRKLSSVKPPMPSQSASTICFLPALPLPAPLLLLLLLALPPNDHPFFSGGGGGGGGDFLPNSAARPLGFSSTGGGGGGLRPKSAREAARRGAAAARRVAAPCRAAARSTPPMRAHAIAAPVRCRLSLLL